jgi:valyl-tRNA synthetase
MPFLTEELWQMIEERKEGESIMISEMPKVQDFDKKIIEDFDFAKSVISEIRTVRKGKNIPMKDSLELFVKSDAFTTTFKSVIAKIANLDKIEMVAESVEGASSFMVSTTEFFVPLGNLINVEEELKKLEEELKYNKGFLISVSKKLSNERFVNNAPEKVVNIEKQKLADAENKIEAIEKQIASLKA